MAAEARRNDYFLDRAGLSSRTLRTIGQTNSIKDVRLKLEKFKKPCRNEDRVFPVTVIKMLVFADLTPTLQEYVALECMDRGITVNAIHVISPTEVFIPNREPERY